MKFLLINALFPVYKFCKNHSDKIETVKFSLPIQCLEILGLGEELHFETRVYVLFKIIKQS